MLYSDLPATPRYLENFISLFAGPLAKGQSVTVFSLPLCGKTGFIKYFLREGGKISEEIGAFRAKFLFLYLDLLSLKKREEIEVEVKKQIGGEDVEETLRDLTFNRQRKVVIIFDSAEELLRLPTSLNQLFFLWSKINPMAINFLFLSGAEISLKETENRLGGLFPLFWQNRFFLSLTTKEDLLAAIANQEEWHNFKIADKVKDGILEISGGWGVLMRALLRRAGNENIKNFSWSDFQDDQEILGLFNLLYASLSHQSQAFLKKKAKKPTEYLLQTRAIVWADKKYQYFSPWLEDYLKRLAKTESPSFVEKAGQLFWEGKLLEEVLTPQEMAVFELFWQKRNKIVTRDEIAQVMWGEDWIEKYSDWAVDKLIARIRQKLGDTGTKRLIRVIKGKGLKLRVVQ